jgi:hypothetical protein
VADARVAIVIGELGALGAIQLDRGLREPPVTFLIKQRGERSDLRRMR